MATLSASASSSSLGMQNATLDLSSISPLLQNEIELWTTRIQYNHLLQTMNTNVTDVWKFQKEQSAQTRKALSDTTKFFKKSVKNVESAILQLHSDDAEISSEDGSIVSNAVKNQIITCMESLSQECRSTIKLYQEEIDTLTRRCKNVEQEYTSLYSHMSNASDPAILYRQSYDVIVSQNQQLTQLLQTVDSLKQELDHSEKMCNEFKEKLKRLEETQLQKASNSLSNEERDELKSLRKEVAEYEVEFRSLKNQDITIRKLEEKIKELQIAGEESIRNSIEQAKQEIAYNEGRRLTEALERESALIAKVQTLELQLKSERVGREMTQNNLLIADDRVSNQEAVWEVQKNILMDDNVRVREALQSVTRERDDLLQELEAVKSSRDTAKRTPPASSGVSIGGSSGGVVSFQDLLLERNAYEAEVSELSETNVMLREEIRLKDERMLEESRSNQVKIDLLDREKQSLTSKISALEMQLSSVPSPAVFENMKRELRILKRLQYNAADDAIDDDVDTDRDPEIAGGCVSIVGSNMDENDIEAVLVNKLRRVEKELITERNLRSELAETIKSLKESLSQAEQAKLECEQLVASLEKDLERAISTPKTAQSKYVDVNRLVPLTENPSALEQILDPTAISPPPSLPPLKLEPSKSSTEKAEDDHSVATIVMAQRDRLRARCEALEAERDSFKRELQGQVQAAESLKADNTKLYEKVRFLQNFNKSSTTASKSSGASGLYHRSTSIGDRDLDLEALEQRYEASVDPFKQFSKSERQRKLDEMSPMERTVFVVAKTVLSTKEMRTGLFFYVLALHLLVFITTYHWSASGNGCDFYSAHESLSHLPPKLPEHIQKQIIAKDAAENDPLHRKI